MATLYSSTVDAIDRRVAAIGSGSLRSPGTAPGAALGLYRGISEWCDDDVLLTRVADAEDFYLSTDARPSE
jgi:hypothetical protein